MDRALNAGTTRIDLIEKGGGWRARGGDGGAVEPISGPNVIPRRARPGLAGLRPHRWGPATTKLMAIFPERDGEGGRQKRE
jgi:hypothetical protein